LLVEIGAGWPGVSDKLSEIRDRAGWSGTNSQPLRIGYPRPGRVVDTGGGVEVADFRHHG